MGKNGVPISPFLRKTIGSLAHARRWFGIRRHLIATPRARLAEFFVFLKRIPFFRLCPRGLSLPAICQELVAVGCLVENTRSRILRAPRPAVVSQLLIGQGRIRTIQFVLRERPSKRRRHRNTNGVIFRLLRSAHAAQQQRATAQQQRRFVFFQKGFVRRCAGRNTAGPARGGSRSGDFTKRRGRRRRRRKLTRPHWHAFQTGGLHLCLKQIQTAGIRHLGRAGRSRGHAAANAKGIANAFEAAQLVKSGQCTGGKRTEGRSPTAPCQRPNSTAQQRVANDIGSAARQANSLTDSRTGARRKNIQRHGQRNRQYVLETKMFL